MKDIFGRHIPEKKQGVSGIRDEFLKTVGADCVLQRLVRRYVGWAYTYRKRTDPEWWKQQFIAVRLVAEDNNARILEIFKLAYTKQYGVLVNPWQVEEALKREQKETLSDNKDDDDELLSDDDIKRIRGKE